MDKELLTTMIDMGFPEVRARKGIYHGVSLEGAVAWISENDSDPNIDQPYMVRKKDTIPKVRLPNPISNWV